MAERWARSSNDLGPSPRLLCAIWEAAAERARCHTHTHTKGPSQPANTGGGVVRKSSDNDDCALQTVPTYSHHHHTDGNLTGIALIAIARNSPYFRFSSEVWSQWSTRASICVHVQTATSHMASLDFTHIEQPAG